ncbi:FecR family protein [Novosphingobium malaysiense]|uniref:FecR family protein n=1 Tax=Novosphingobium malaysiense TaxID=1348853 RepID=UPI00068FFA5A|nr:FecR domain-containing protein [Novosphingobium malaysiense]
MSDEEANGAAARSRMDKASDWFARMRGPDAFRSRTRFEAWLADPDNARAYREIEQVWAATGRRRPSHSRPRARARPGARHRYALAASLGLIAIMLALILFTSRQWRGQALPATAYSSHVGEIRQVRLADGSRVTLDTASRLSVDFSPGKRQVALLSGRARFDVAHDATRPFVVTAGNRAVVARGTVFDVRIEGATVEVTLLRGSVDVERLQSRAPPRHLARLLPGQRAVMRGADPAAQVDRAASGVAAWTSGLLPADRLPLSALLAEANRYSPRKIVLADPQLGRLRVTGAFRPGDPVALAAKLGEALDLAVTVRSDGSVLVARKPGRPD